MNNHMDNTVTLYHVEGTVKAVLYMWRDPNRVSDFLNAYPEERPRIRARVAELQRTLWVIHA